MKIIALSLALSFGVASSALAQASIQSLSNGNYRFCSNPPPSDVVSDEEFLTAGHCFLFRKTGNRVVGAFFDMSTYGEVGVCATGTISGNTITGEAIETFPPEGEPLPVEPEFQGATPVNWDDNGYLKVARADVNYDQNEEYVSTTIRYRTAVLNLDGFHRYNAGTQSPPSNCNQ